MDLPKIDFNTVPNQNTEEIAKETPQFKPWNLPKNPKFNKQCIKVTKLGKSQVRITLPKLLINAYDIDTTFKAFYIVYHTQNKILLILSKNTIQDADYQRALTPISINLLCTVIPAPLLKQIDIPEYLWLVNTAKSTTEDIILELYPT